MARDLPTRAEGRRAKLGVPRKLAVQPFACTGFGPQSFRRYELTTSSQSSRSVKGLEQGGAGCPRRTLRSPGAERSRQPYAAQPRGRGQADVEDTQRRPRAKN